MAAWSRSYHAELVWHRAFRSAVRLMPLAVPHLRTLEKLSEPCGSLPGGRGAPCCRRSLHGGRAHRGEDRCGYVACPAGRGLVLNWAGEPGARHVMPSRSRQPMCWPPGVICWAGRAWLVPLDLVVNIGGLAVSAPSTPPSGAERDVVAPHLIPVHRYQPVDPLESRADRHARLADPADHLVAAAHLPAAG